LGAEKGINYKKEDFEDVLKETGLDVILDMVGGDYIPKNLRLLKPDGRLVFINAMQGAKGEFNALDLMRRRLTLTGSTLRSREAGFKAELAADIKAQVWPLLEKGAFQPVIHQVFDLSEAAAAHALMESSKHIGKIILKLPE
jgi:NADPH:quinone reductase-like Zn-dependent oxidoreductase